VAEDAGEEAGDGVDEDGGGEFAAGEDVVADAELFVAEVLGDALVDALVAAADEDDAVAGGEAAGVGLGELAALGREQDDAGGGGAGGSGGDGEGFEALEDGLGLEDHAFAAAEGAVVDGAVTVVGEAAEVVDIDLGDAGAEGARDDAVAQDAGAGGGAEEFGEDGEEVEEHKGSE
jgi:hypothetical protein